MSKNDLSRKKFLTAASGKIPESMHKIDRRQFLKQTSAGSALLFTSKYFSQSVSTDSQVEIIIDEPIETISPDIYGHFTEHIGGVIYDGIWVGENSSIPNIGGIRKELVDYMKRLKPSVVRWPGGCFADSYNWRDGIGPREQRPLRPNFWINNRFSQKAPDGPTKYDSNHFGTHEFVHFCRLIGAEPYIAVNVRSATPKDFYEWVDYCNAPAGTTTLAMERETNGSVKPFNVRYWGVGNESWGCGGDFTPEEYAMEFRRFTSWVPNFGQNLALIPAGPSGGDTSWTSKFFTKLTERRRQYLNRVYGWALHYYCGTSGKGQATDFTDEDYYELIVKANRMETLINQHWSAMGEVDKNHRVKLIVDEWGAWHRAGSEVHPTHLFGQTSTMRDALIAALTLDTFNRNADKVIMSNVAQLINCLHSLFLASEDRFIVTPNYYVFDMYSAHQSGQSLKTVFSTPEINITRRGRTEQLWGLNGSASLHEKKLVLTVVNPSLDKSRNTEIIVHGAKIKSGEAKTLSEADVRLHNSFNNPNAVFPKENIINIKRGSLVYTSPPASVVRLIFELA